ERRIGVALHLDDRERTTREPPIRVEHRILTISPGLIGQTALLAAGIVEKAGRAVVERPGRISIQAVERTPFEAHAPDRRDHGRPSALYGHQPRAADTRRVPCAHVLAPRRYRRNRWRRRTSAALAHRGR